MTARDAVDVAAHVVLDAATLPLMGFLGLVSLVRDTAARSRVREEFLAEQAVAWDRLLPDERVLVMDWKYGH